MGTRGTYGFHKNGEDKLTYNHFDSYPSGLGADIVQFIKSCSLKDLNDICDAIILVNEDSIPTEEQIEECLQWYNGSVSDRTTQDWYCLLRRSQGKFDAYRQGLKYMIKNNDFIKDSLFCEWGYIINLDTNMLEVYEGFQKEPNNNRYACEPDGSGYYNCKLAHEFPLSDIPDNWMMIVDPEED